jgi:hypothetical protein
LRGFLNTTRRMELKGTGRSSMIQFQNLRFRSVQSCSPVYSSAMVDARSREVIPLPRLDLEGWQLRYPCTASPPQFDDDAATSQKRVPLRTTWAACILGAACPTNLSNHDWGLRRQPLSMAEKATWGLGIELASRPTRILASSTRLQACHPLPPHVVRRLNMPML